MLFNQLNYIMTFLTQVRRAGFNWYPAIFRPPFANGQFIAFCNAFCYSSSLISLNLLVYLFCGMALKRKFVLVCTMSKHLIATLRPCQPSLYRVLRHVGGLTVPHGLTLGDTVGRVAGYDFNPDA